jgi:hypothetical protein
MAFETGFGIDSSGVEEQREFSTANLARRRGAVVRDLSGVAVPAGCPII